ncbi:hypothetical protein RCH09_000309 [Actimicrobium sp. GrIS 1.19]|uniref:hypothetical protein n=1 Tax=Actimicrobium sp. GrIS 1.19 TaxID=3071708 RepID=UPI002E00F7D3|nr:hypothetical protein [Actimicrobium sp. GrIS 1.19]
MSIFAITPLEAAIPAAQVFGRYAATAARPLFGIGIAVGFLMVFKPMLTGLLRAGVVLLKPRPTFAQRSQRSHLRGMLMLNRMANDLESSQPNVASELRAFASRD